MLSYQRGVIKVSNYSENANFIIVDQVVEGILDSKGISLQEILRAASKDTEIKYQPLVLDSSIREKSMLPVLIGSAAVIAAITPLLMELLREHTRKDIVISQRVLVLSLIHI